VGWRRLPASRRTLPQVRCLASPSILHSKHGSSCNMWTFQVSAKSSLQLCILQWPLYSFTAGTNELFQWYVGSEVSTMVGMKCGILQRAEISWLAEQLSASQERPCSMECFGV
jgi:hypothetical protein